MVGGRKMAIVNAAVARITDTIAVVCRVSEIANDEGMAKSRASAANRTIMYSPSLTTVAP